MRYFRLKAYRRSIRSYPRRRRGLFMYSRRRFGNLRNPAVRRRLRF